MISCEARPAPASGGTGAQAESLAQRALHVLPVVTSQTLAAPGPYHDAAAVAVCAAHG